MSTPADVAAVLEHLSARGILIRQRPSGRFGVWPLSCVPAHLRAQLAQHRAAVMAVAANAVRVFGRDVAPLALWLQHTPAMRRPEPLALGLGETITDRARFRDRLLSDLDGWAGTRPQQHAADKLHRLFALLVIETPAYQQHQTPQPLSEAA